MKLYMFWKVRLSIIRSLFTVHSALVCVIQVCRQFLSRTRMELQFHPGPARKLSTNMFDIPMPSVQWINSLWWTDELSETYRVSCQNKLVKLLHLVGFIIIHHVNLTLFYKKIMKFHRFPSLLADMQYFQTVYK